MSSIYTKNIQAMKDRYPDVVEYLDKEQQELTEEFASVEPFITEVDGRKILAARADDRVYQLDSLYSDDIYSLWISKVRDEWDLETKFILYGLGTGKTVRAFLENVRQDCSIVVHEPSVKMFRCVLENYDLSDLFKDRRFRLVFWPAVAKDSVKKYYSENVLQYKDVDADGTKKTPVVLHRAILGSLDRFMAYILEETKGKLPTWLSPVQVKVLPLSDKYIDYSQKVYERLLDEGIRAEIDTRDEKIGYKIREARLERVPYMLVLGQNEEEAGNVAVRSRFAGDEGAKDLNAFVGEIKEEIFTKKIREEVPQGK